MSMFQRALSGPWSTIFTALPATTWPELMTAPPDGAGGGRGGGPRAPRGPPPPPAGGAAGHLEHLGGGLVRALGMRRAAVQRGALRLGQVGHDDRERAGG